MTRSRRWHEMAALDGLKILVPESRELDLFVSMLEAEGATALRCPLVRIADLEDTAEAEAWIARLLAGAFQDVVWLTGEGLRRLVTIAKAKERYTEFVAALDIVRNVTRGPKPARALREIGLSARLAAETPTSQGVFEALSGENLAGRSIGVQLYPGDGARHLVERLLARKARVSAVTPYRYANEAETERVADAIDALIAGRVALIAFTASPQVDRLFDVANRTGRLIALRQSFERATAAAIGPIVEQRLHARGIRNVVRPDSSFHLKPLVRAIVAWRSP